MALYLMWLTQTLAMGFWLMDILNMPFMEMFDTTYPLNGVFYFGMFLISEVNKINLGEAIEYARKKK